MNDDAINEMTGFMREYTERSSQRRTERFATLRAKFLPMLRGLNVATVTMRYDGYGDSTDECTLTFLNAKGAQVLVPDADENELIDILFRAVPDGYENNEGGYGEVVLNVAAGSIKNNHAQRYTDATHSEQEYTL